MDAVTFVAAILVWGVLPGFVLLSVLRPGWHPVERIAAAPGLSLALVAASAYATELLGLPIAPLPVLAVAAGIAAAGSIGRRAAGWGVAPDARRPAWLPPSGMRLAPWLVLLLPIAVVQALEPVSTVPILPPSLHDGLDHATWFRLIYETHSLDPHVVMAPPLLPDGSPTYYPWGLHAWMALVAQTTTLDPVAVLMRCLVATSAALPLSVYVFTAYCTGRGWPAVAAAGFSLLFWWLPYQVWGWGGYPLLAGAVAALPLSRLAMTSVGARHAAGTALAVVCGIGLLTIHPSQAFVALLVAVVTTGTLAASRLLPWWTTLPFLAALAAAGVTLGLGDAWWAPLDAFLARASEVGTTLAGDPRYDWPTGVYFDRDSQFPVGRRVVFGLLCLIGALVAIGHGPARPLVALHVAFSLFVPLAVDQTWLTSLWYHDPERIWYVQYASLPALAALGVAGALGVLMRLSRRWFDARRWTGLLWLLALWGAFEVLHPPYALWTSQRLFVYAQRNENLTVTDRRLLSDFEWVRLHVPRGEVLMNAPADWGLPLPFTGHRTVFWSGGPVADRMTDWDAIVRMLNRGGVDAAHAGREMARAGLRYLFAADVDPRMERSGRAAFDRRALGAAPGFERLYESPSALVLRVADDPGESLGLRESGRLRLSGVHDVEGLGMREWLWTDGDARLRIRTGRPAGECFLRVHGPEIGTYTLSAAGAPLELTARGFRLPRPDPDGDAIELELVSSSVVPAQAGTGTDERRLGVRIEDLSLACGPSRRSAVERPGWSDEPVLDGPRRSSASERRQSPLDIRTDVTFSISVRTVGSTSAPSTNL